MGAPEVEHIKALGARIAGEFRRRDLDERSLPEIASRALEALPPPSPWNARAVLEWACSTEVLPPQTDPEGKFGQPPLSVYHGTGFQLDVLYWFDGTTSIHQHAFQGLFHVLSGSSIHTRYRFELERRVSSHLLAGRVEREHVELLRAGDSRPFSAGPSFIHALYHLDRPSVTLVIRTSTDADNQPQYDYHPPGFAYNDFYVRTQLQRRLQSLGALYRVESPEREAVARAMLTEVDFGAAYLTLLHLSQLEPDPDRLARLADGARGRHGQLVDRTMAVIEERQRQSVWIAARRRVKDPDLRFLLALLLNAPDRASVLELVRARHPGAEPSERVAGWLGELGRVAEPAPAKSLLGVELGEMEIAVVRGLLQGVSMAGLHARLAEEYDGVDEEAAAIDELCAALRGSKLLGPLFA